MRCSARGSVEKGNETLTIETGNEILTIDKGDQTTKVTVGTSSLTAGKKIVLKVGGSSIVMDATSITIKSQKIIIEAGMTINVKASLVLKLESGITAELKAGANLTVKGGMVMIN